MSKSKSNREESGYIVKRTQNKQNLYPGDHNPWLELIPSQTKIEISGKF